MNNDWFGASEIQKQFIKSIENYKNKEKKKKAVRFSISGIDVNRLVSELQKRQFFDSRYEADVLKWFKGERPEDPIPLNVSLALFVSIIADLMDWRPKLISNTKEFVYNYIKDSFLFNGKQPEISSIKQIMKPSAPSRASYQTKTIPNIKEYTT